MASEVEGTVLSDEQTVFIARYGLRETGLVEFEGPFDMDIAPDGVRAAEELAARLKSEGVTRILCSPFLRALHTAHVVADELDLPVCVEPGITEWLTPSLVGRDAPYEPPAVVDLAKRFPRVDTAYEPVLHPSPAAYPESEERLLERMAAVAGKLADAAYPHNVLLVSHAPCNLAIAMALEGKGVAGSALGPWPLGGLASFSRGESGAAWRMGLNMSTEHLSGDEHDGMQAWTLPCLEARASS